MRLSRLMTAATPLLMLFAAQVLAGDTPTELKGATIVDAAKVKEVAAGGAKVFDLRSPAVYAEEHIPGAVSLPYKEKSKMEVNFDPALDKFDVNAFGDKSTPIVLYCGGTDCWRSYKAAKLAHDAGYKTVYWFRGGFPEWKKAGLPIEK